MCTNILEQFVSAATIALVLKRLGIRGWFRGRLLTWRHRRNRQPAVGFIPFLPRVHTVTDAPGPEEPTSTELARERAEEAFEKLFRNTWLNTVLAWLFVGVLLGVWLDSIVDLDFLWIVFVTATGVIVLLPPTVYRDTHAMLPWELLVLALAPILVRGLFGGDLGTFGYYLSVAALALLVVVELHMFTELELTHWFAVVLVVQTTLAAVAASTMLRFAMDVHLGTNFLSTNEALMDEWVSVTLAGVIGGLLFDAYFKDRDRQLASLLRGVIRR